MSKGGTFPFPHPYRMSTFRPRATALLLPLVLAACGGDGDGPIAPGGTRLTPGEARVLAAAAGSQRLFTVNVPAGTGTLRVQLRDGTGDADLVIRHGTRPQTGLYDCVSEEPNTLEECIIDAPAAGTWYVLVVGHAAYRDVRLSALLGAESGATALQSGVPVTGLSGGAGAFRMFAIDVPAGASLEVTTTAASGDADLFVRQGTFPLLNQYDCASWGSGGSERCQRWATTAGTWYVRVEGFTPYAGLTLTATVTPAAAP